MHTLTGAAVTGESWRLTLAGRNYSVAVDVTNDTLAKIATRPATWSMPMRMRPTLRQAPKAPC